MKNILHEKNIRNTVILGLAALLLVLAANQSEKITETENLREEMTTEFPTKHVEEELPFVFGSVPYFRDDTGKSAQLADGYLYGYWGGRLCRYDMDTLEETVLYEAVSNQAGSFCIHEGYVYFLERSYVSSLSGEDTRLYRIKCDGTELTLLAEQIPNAGGDYGYQWYSDDYQIDIYDDIVYLLCGSGENLYFRILENGSVMQVSEAETLYGMLPEGYSAFSIYSDMPSLPYAMRNFGYLFLENEEEGQLALFDAKSGQIKRSDIPCVRYLFATNAALFYAVYEAEQGIYLWYRVSLDYLCDRENWTGIETSTMYPYEILWNEAGIYFADRDEDNLVHVYKAEHQGGSIEEIKTIEEKYTVFPFRYGALCYADEENFYYNDRREGNNCIVRCRLNGNKMIHAYNASDETELVAIYREDETEGIAYYETTTRTYDILETWEALPDYSMVNIELQKVFLTEDTTGAQKINAYMDRVYAEFEEQQQDYQESMETIHGESPDTIGSYSLIASAIDYMDESYLSISVCEEIYGQGAAHPNSWTTNYVFDRVTGERLAVTDIVADTPEEICEIAGEYVEKVHPFDEYLEPESILEERRFFLSEEGIGIHYDTYELSDYASGYFDFIIPYRAFALKNKDLMGCEFAKSDGAYLIWNNTQLETLSEMIKDGAKIEPGVPAATASYRLLKDIDARDWLRIGSAKEPFAGNFDGGGNVITGIGFYIHPDESAEVEHLEICQRGQEETSLSFWIRNDEELSETRQLLESLPEESIDITVDAGNLDTQELAFLLQKCWDRNQERERYGITIVYWASGQEESESQQITMAPFMSLFGELGGEIMKQEVAGGDSFLRFLRLERIGTLEVCTFAVNTKEREEYHVLLRGTWEGSEAVFQHLVIPATGRSEFADNNYFLTQADINFDGKEDLLIHEGNSGGSGGSWGNFRGILWNEAAEEFAYYPSFPEQLVFLEFNEERMISREKSGVFFEHVVVYEIVNGEYVLSRELIWNRMEGTLSYYEMRKLVRVHDVTGFSAEEIKALYPDMDYWTEG